MSILAALKAAATRKDVADILQMTLKGLTAILHTRDIAQRYTIFSIPKRGGGTREIKAPDDKLKLLQQKLSLVLQDCFEEIHGQRQTSRTVSHGFRRKYSIITNAKLHRHRRWVFNIDLENFFPSLHFGRVRGFFLKDKQFELQPIVATVIAQIACDGNALPQGSPCSPVISNLICHILDMHVARLARSAGCTYSRYADDLTFSTNKKEFPPEIAVRTTDPHVWIPGLDLQERIDHARFVVNKKKTRMQYRDARQEVTGLIVNQKINVRHEYRHNVRAMVHSLFSTGSFQVYGQIVDNGVVTLGMREGTLDELHGRLGFINSIDLVNKRDRPQDIESAHLSKKEQMYRQFLIYRDFYAADCPVILCEGKTDNVYLKHAIRRLAAQYPQLTEVGQDGKPRLTVRLYKYVKSSTGRILGLRDGGTSHLKDFVTAYKKDTDKFKGPGMHNPVILLLDNDSGANGICNAIRDMSPTKQPVDRDAPYTHVVKNLYCVLTPRQGANPSKIEDFFDSNTTATVLGGKEFTAENNFDASKYYGKAIFAEKVVAQHASSIDFSGFGPLLKNICTVIAEHTKTLTGRSAATARGTEPSSAAADCPQTT